MNWLKRFCCWVLGHCDEPAVIFLSLHPEGVAAKRCVYCGRRVPTNAGRVVSGNWD